MTNYDLTFLTTEGWKKYQVETDKTPKEISGYVSSPYTKKLHIEESKSHDPFGYIKLEDAIPEHPHYPIPSDKALNYFKTTKHDYIYAEVFEIKRDFDVAEQKKKKREKFFERFF